MTSEDDARAIAIEMAQALALLRAGHTLYAGILDSVKATVGDDGNADIPELVRQLNAALTAYAPHDFQAQALLAKYD